MLGTSKLSLMSEMGHWASNETGLLMLEELLDSMIEVALAMDATVLKLLLLLVELVASKTSSTSGNCTE